MLVIICWNVFETLAAWMHWFAKCAAEQYEVPTIKVFSLENFTARLREESCFAAEVEILRATNQNGLLEDWVDISISARPEWRRVKILYTAEERIPLPLDVPEAERAAVDFRARMLGKALNRHGIQAWVINEAGHVIYPPQK